jgi:hypothetical protein
MTSTSGLQPDGLKAQARFVELVFQHDLPGIKAMLKNKTISNLDFCIKLKRFARIAVAGSRADVTNYSFSPLLAAMYSEGSKRKEIVDLLLDAGASIFFMVNTKQLCLPPAICVAASPGLFLRDEGILAELLARSADAVNAQDPVLGSTPLHFVLFGSPPFSPGAAGKLIAAGADVHRADARFLNLIEDIVRLAKPAVRQPLALLMSEVENALEHRRWRRMRLLQEAAPQLLNVLAAIVCDYLDHFLTEAEAKMVASRFADSRL